MTTKDHFKALMGERRMFAPGSVEHTWRTRAARKLAWIIRGVPSSQWGAMQ